MDTPLNEIGRGGLQSPHDYRDDIVAASVVADLAAIALPATFDTDLTAVGPVLMQAKTPACVSHSIAEVLKLYWFRKTGVVHNFSPRFLDTLVKRFDGCDRATDGTYPRMVMRLAAQYGCATEDVLPNDTNLPILEYRDDAKLTPDVFANAAQFKIPGYFRVPTDKQSTRASIFLHGAISTLFRVGHELWTAADGTITWDPAKISPLRIPNPVESGHQMTPKGWLSAPLNRLRNSWSEAWANHGEADYDPVAWYPFIIEQWGVAEIPANTLDFLKQLPKAEDFHYQWGTDLHLGDFSDDVKFAQIALMILGLLSGVAAEDLGHYGPKTAAAVARYQQAHRISPVPNSIGPKTRAALNAQFAL